MACRFLSGDPQYYNLFARAAALGNLTVLPTPSTLFPSSALTDGLSGLIWMASTNSGAHRITADANLVRNGSLDTLAPWWFSGGGTGTALTDTSFKRSGTASLKLTTSSGGGAISYYQDIVVRAGDQLKLDMWNFNDGTTNTIGQYSIRNLNNSHYYVTASNSWQSTTTNINANATAGTGGGSWANTTLQFTVEDYAASGYNDYVTIRLTLRSSNASITSNTWWDDVYMWPVGINSVCLVGYNPAWADTIYVEGSSDNSNWSATLATVMSFTRPNLWITFSDAGYRYYRLEYSSSSGTNPTGGQNVSIGELIMGRSQALTFGLQNPGQQAWEIGYKQPQIRNTTPAGMSFVNNLSSQPLRTMKIPMQAASEAERLQILYDLYARSGFGRYPSLVIPEETESTVIFGRLAGDANINRVMAGVGNYYESELAIEELELPTVVS